jgi:hypothetical protein
MPEFSINFGNAKTLEPLKLPEEGNYELVITSYEIKQAKKEESRAKGFNVAIQFHLVDEPEFANNIIFHNVWVQYDNPWSAKLFFEALTGKTLDDDSLDITDANYFIGEHVGATLTLESYLKNNGEPGEKLVVADPNHFYTV